MSNQTNQLQQQLDKLRKEQELLKKLITVAGFIDEYFDNLSKFKTQIDTFEFVNNQYYDLTGEFRFLNYESFRVILYRYRKKNK